MERSIAKSSQSGISCHHLSMLCTFTFYTNNNRSSSAIPLYWLIKNFHSTVRMHFCPQKWRLKSHTLGRRTSRAKKFITTIQINLCPNSSFTRNQHKTEQLLLKFFAIDQPSQPLLCATQILQLFHLVAILCRRAARLGCTLFYSMNGCF